MTAKEFLNRAYRIDCRINTKFEQLERMRALATRSTQAFGTEPVSHSRNLTSLQDSIVRIMEYEKELDMQIDVLVDIKKEIQYVIDLVANEDCRLLLEMRYLSMKRWSDIGAALSLCERQVFRLHGQALSMVDTVLRTMEMSTHEA